MDVVMSHNTRAIINDLLSMDLSKDDILFLAGCSARINSISTLDYNRIIELANQYILKQAGGKYKVFEFHSAQLSNKKRR